MLSHLLHSPTRAHSWGLCLSHLSVKFSAWSQYCELGKRSAHWEDQDVGLHPFFVDPHGERGWSPRSSSKPLRYSVKAQLPQRFKWTSGKSKRRRDAPSPCPEAALAVAHVQSKFQPGKLIPGMALVQLGWEVLALAEKVMPGPAHM